jgi:cycloeucalenol cycloisomerase
VSAAHVINVADNEGGRPAARWFSANPDKAWAEKLFLLYTPYWMACMGTLMLTGAGERWGDSALNLAMLAIIAPLVVVPLLAGRATAAGRPWWRCYWFKATAWLAVFSGMGSYFGSEYFFDVLGMYYRYPQLEWTLDSALIGSGAQAVPLIMYPSALFYFVSYHAAAVVLLRRAGGLPLLSSRWAQPLLVVAVAYLFAWAETFFMAGGSIEQQFGYSDLPRMLKWGSLFYACYFLVSFPMFRRLDERPGENWSLRRVVVEALAASMGMLLLLDLATHFVGRLY